MTAAGIVDRSEPLREQAIDVWHWLKWWVVCRRFGHRWGPWRLWPRADIDAMFLLRACRRCTAAESIGGKS